MKKIPFLSLSLFLLVAGGVARANSSSGPYYVDIKVHAYISPIYAEAESQPYDAKTDAKRLLYRTANFMTREASARGVECVVPKDFNPQYTAVSKTRATCQASVALYGESLAVVSQYRDYCASRLAMVGMSRRIILSAPYQKDLNNKTVDLVINTTTSVMPTSAKTNPGLLAEVSNDAAQGLLGWIRSSANSFKVKATTSRGSVTLSGAPDYVARLVSMGAKGYSVSRVFTYSSRGNKAKAVVRALATLTPVDIRLPYTPPPLHVEIQPKEPSKNNLNN